MQNFLFYIFYHFAMICFQLRISLNSLSGSRALLSRPLSNVCGENFSFIFASAARLAHSVKQKSWPKLHLCFSLHSVRCCIFFLLFPFNFSQLEKREKLRKKNKFQCNKTRKPEMNLKQKIFASHKCFLNVQKRTEFFYNIRQEETKKE